MGAKKKFLSASRMGTLDKCTWLYWVKYHLNLPDKTNSGALRGSLCHLVFELLLKPRHKHHYKGIIKAKDISGSKAILRLVNKHLKSFETNSVKGVIEQEDYDLVNKMIYVGLDHNFFGHKGAKIDNPEQEFKIENENPRYNIYGFMDKPIKYKGKKTIKIVDYKSSKAKFRGEELESNIQAMMYTLASKKIWPEFKRVIIQFLFLRFPKSPVQELEFTDEQLKGFEHYLEHINEVINNFTEENAKSKYAADSFKTKWLCGPTKSGWECPHKKPYDYYVLLNKDNEAVKSSFSNDLSPKKGERVEKMSYDGCPRFNSSAQAQAQEDLFDF